MADRGKVEGHRTEGGGQRLQDHTVSSRGHGPGDTGRESVSCQTRTEFTVTQTEDTVLNLTSGFPKFLSCDLKPGFSRLGAKINGETLAYDMSASGFTYYPSLQVPTQQKAPLKSSSFPE